MSSPKLSRVIPSSSSSPVPSVRIPRAMPCHLPLGKKPLEEITSARTAPGFSHAQRSPISAPQSCITSATGPSASPACRRMTASI